MERHQDFTVITILIIIFAILHSGETKRCYSCSSYKSDTCASKPSASETVPCDGFVCVKCNHETFSGKTIVQRGCRGVGRDAFESAITFECYTCGTNLCNNANALSTSMVALGCLALFWMMQFALITDSY